MAAQRVPSGAALDAALLASNHPTDSVLDFELHKAALVLRPYWYPEFAAGKLTFDNDPKRLSFALSAARVADAVPRLLELYGSGKLSTDSKADVLANVAALGTAEQLAIVLQAAAKDEPFNIEQRARLFSVLARTARDRHVQPKSDLSALSPLLKRQDTLGAATIRAAGAWKLESLRNEIEQLSQNRSADAVRQAAVAALVELGGNATTTCLAKLSATDQPFAVRADAIAGLAQLDLPKAATLAAALLHEPLPSGADPSLLFAAFLHRADGEQTLAKAMASAAPTVDAARIGIGQIRASGLSTTHLTGLLGKLADSAGHHRDLSPALQRRLVSLAQTHGDPARGEKLFHSPTLGCMQCHAIAGAGGSLAPDLAAVGSSSQPDFLVEHLILPSKSVKDGFVALQVVTRDGDAYSGIRVRENAADLVLKDVTHDEIVIAKSSIAKQKDIGTLMPTGLTDGLSDDQFADLVQFLMELGRPGPYAVSQAQVQRQWRVLSPVPEYLALLDATACGRSLRDDAGLSWARGYTNVAGELSIADVVPEGQKSAVARAALSVTTPGKLVVSVNDPDGLRIWLDGVPLSSQAQLSLDLAAGLHTLDFWIDRSSRKVSSLRCEMVDSPQSTARAQWAPNR